MDYGKYDIIRNSIKFKYGCYSQIQQQVVKEYQQLKNIQKELEELSIDLQQSPAIQAVRRQMPSAVMDSEKNPAAWFRPEPDIWMPPSTSRDPDVWPPPSPSDSRLVILQKRTTQLSFRSSVLLLTQHSINFF